MPAPARRHRFIASTLLNPSAAGPFDAAPLVALASRHRYAPAFLGEQHRHAGEVPRADRGQAGGEGQARTRPAEASEVNFGEPSGRSSWNSTILGRDQTSGSGHAWPRTGEAERVSSSWVVGIAWEPSRGTRRPVDVPPVPSGLGSCHGP